MHHHYVHSLLAAAELILTYPLPMEAVQAGQRAAGQPGMCPVCCLLSTPRCVKLRKYKNDYAIFRCAPSHRGIPHTSHVLGLVILCILNPKCVCYQLLESPLTFEKLVNGFFAPD